MSRLYTIAIGAGPSGNAGATFTNQLPGGGVDLGAPKVELDIPAFGFAAPAGQAYIKIWGVSIAQVEEAADFNGAPVSVFGGMQAGLPLATAAAGQSGLLLSGTVFQSFGNWMGVNQTLDLVVTTDGGATQSKPAALSFSWKAGTPMSAMLQQVLAQAYPGLGVDVRISPSLVLPADESGVYQTIQQFSSWAQRVSQQINTDPTYPGVTIALRDGKMVAFDGTQPASTAPRSISFQDLVGQPTWLGAYTIQFNAVMRADLGIGDKVKLPALAGLQSTTSPQSQSQARGKLTFSGDWTLSYIRHIGDSRGPSAQDWVTTFQAFSSSAPQSVTNQAANTSA